MGAGFFLVDVGPFAMHVTWALVDDQQLSFLCPIAFLRVLHIILRSKHSTAVLPIYGAVLAAQSTSNKTMQL